METPYYLVAQIGFTALTLICLILFFREFQKGLRMTGWESGRRKNFATRIVIFLLVWAGFVAAWSLSGKMSDFSLFPLNLAPVILVPAIVAIFFIPARSTGEVLRHIPPSNLIRLQSFRFFVEVLLWLLFVAELLPIQMTFEGRNFDILAGFTAPIIAVLATRSQRPRTLLFVWNLICLGLLLNIVITAILSTPSPWRVFMNEPANTIVAHFPVSLLPGFLVPLAYYLHFLSLRQAANMHADKTRN